jgi:hypothetical protein
VPSDSSLSRLGWSLPAKKVKLHYVDELEAVYGAAPHGIERYDFLVMVISTKTRLRVSLFPRHLSSSSS